MTGQVWPILDSIIKSTNPFRAGWIFKPIYADAGLARCKTCDDEQMAQARHSYDNSSM
jgi:hypothetical protein